VPAGIVTIGGQSLQSWKLATGRIAGCPAILLQPSNGALSKASSVSFRGNRLPRFVIPPASFAVHPIAAPIVATRVERLSRQRQLVEYRRSP
jgi:hypothetical protein